MQGLRGSRAVVERHWALLPPEGIPESVLPDWNACAARILAAPAMGAAFAQYRLDLAAGGGTEGTLAADTQGFFYVLEGRARLDVNGRGHALTRGLDPPAVGRGDKTHLKGRSSAAHGRAEPASQEIG